LDVFNNPGWKKEILLTLATQKRKKEKGKNKRHFPFLIHSFRPAILPDFFTLPRIFADGEGEGGFAPRLQIPPPLLSLSCRRSSGYFIISIVKGTFPGLSGTYILT